MLQHTLLDSNFVDQHQTRDVTVYTAGDMNPAQSALLLPSCQDGRCTTQQAGNTGWMGPRSTKHTGSMCLLRRHTHGQALPCCLDVGCAAYF